MAAQPKDKYSVRQIVGPSGKNYGTGVYLDSTLLDNLSEDERMEMVKELGGNVFTADGPEPATHPHDWVDNNGQNNWDVWTTYNPDDLQSYLDDPDNVIIYDKKKGLPEVGSGSKLPSHLTDKPFYEDIVTRPKPEVNKNSDRNSDRNYMAAVNSGDMETAQRMVDEAAKAAG